MSQDKTFYLAAMQELDEKTHDKALWAKSMTLNSGDEEQARYAYVNERVAELAAEAEPASVQVAEPEPKVVKKPERIPDPVPTVLGSEFISVADFAHEKGLAETKAISMIKDGFYQGRVVEGNWYAHRSSLDNGHGAAGRKYSDNASLLNLGAMVAGELPLVWTFWGWYIVAFQIFYFASAFLLALLLPEAVFEESFDFLHLMIFIVPAVMVLVGTWRSAGRYEGIPNWGLATRWFIGVTLIGGVILGLAGV